MSIKTKPTQRLVLPGQPIPKMTIVDTLINLEFKIQSLNFMFQSINYKSHQNVVIVKTGKWKTKHPSGDYVPVDKYILFPNQVINDLKSNTHLEDIKKRINVLLETPNSNQTLGFEFPQTSQSNKHFIIFYWIPQIKAIRIAMYAYKNQELIEYFEKKCVEKINYLLNINTKSVENQEFLKVLES